MIQSMRFEGLSGTQAGNRCLHASNISVVMIRVTRVQEFPFPVVFLLYFHVFSDFCIFFFQLIIGILSENSFSFLVVLLFFFVF